MGKASHLPSCLPRHMEYCRADNIAMHNCRLEHKLAIEEQHRQLQMEAAARRRQRQQRLLAEQQEQIAEVDAR